MMSLTHLVDAARSGSIVRTGLVVLVSSLALAPLAAAERFHSRQSLTVESNKAETKKVGTGVEVSGTLANKGLWLFIVGNNEDVISITMTSEFSGSPNAIKGKGVQTITFGDGSELKLTLDMVSQGRRFTGKITAAEGSGRFKGATVTGTLSGNAIDPKLTFVELQGAVEKAAAAAAAKN